MLFSQLLIDVLELFGVGGAVIGRQPHPQQQHFDLAPLRADDDGIKVVVHFLQRQSPQAVIPAKFQDEYVGMVAVQKCGDPTAAAGSGFTADAGIDHAAIDALFMQPLFQQGYPALLLI